MSVYDRVFYCPAADCGGDFSAPAGTSDGARVTCPHCTRTYEITDEGENDGRGWRDCSRLTEVPAR